MSQRIHVAIDARAARAQMSGVGRYVINLVEHLVNLGELDITLLALDDVHPRLVATGARIVSLGEEANRPNYPQRLRWEQRELPRVLRRIAPDVFHATWNYGVPLAGRISSVITLHDLLPARLPEELPSRSWALAYHVSQRIAIARAKRIVCISTNTLGELRTYQRSAVRRATVILSGIETPCQRIEQDIQKEYLLYVGGFTRRKNVGRLLRAFDAIAPSFPRLELWLTGIRQHLDGESSQIVDGMRAEHVSRVRFMGPVADEKLASLYRSARAMVFPSLAEGFGFPPAEAMAAGAAVLSSNRDSLPEVLGDGAAFFDPEAEGQLESLIANLLADESRRLSLIQRGLLRSTQLSWVTTAVATHREYRLAVGR